METAEAIVADDPESAFVLAYDASRFVGEALLAHQGLRPTQAGGHLAVTDAVRAQFGARSPHLARCIGAVTSSNTSYPGERVEAEEAAAAIRTARDLLTSAQRLLKHLGLFL